MTQKAEKKGDFSKKNLVLFRLMKDEIETVTLHLLKAELSEIETVTL